MRVSESLLFTLMQQRLRDTRSNTAVALQRASTGVRVESPSDDPLAAALDRREINRISRADAILSEIDNALLRLNAADSALDSVGTQLIRTRELTIEAANDTLGAEERRAIAREIEAMREQVIALSNTEAGGSYIFAGYTDNAPPFDAAGNYNGDGNVRELEVAPGVRINTGVAGDTTFGSGSGVDIMAMLEDLRIALDANDVITIRGMLNQITQAHSQITDARVTLGASVNSFEVSRSATQRAHDRATESRNELIGIDPMDAFSDLAKAEQALQAAVTVASTLPLPGLVNNPR